MIDAAIGFASAHPLVALLAALVACFAVRPAHGRASDREIDYIDPHYRAETDPEARAEQYRARYADYTAAGRHPALDDPDFDADFRRRASNAPQGPSIIQ